MRKRWKEGRQDKAHFKCRKRRSELACVSMSTAHWLLPDPSETCPKFYLLFHVLYTSHVERYVPITRSCTQPIRLGRLPSPFTSRVLSFVPFASPNQTPSVSWAKIPPSPHPLILTSTNSLVFPFRSYTHLSPPTHPPHPQPFA